MKNRKIEMHFRSEKIDRKFSRMKNFLLREIFFDKKLT